MLGSITSYNIPHAPTVLHCAMLPYTLCCAVWLCVCLLRRCLFKVADLKHLSLGNTNYIVTKVCRRISRSLSGPHQASSANTPDALAVAAAALGPLAFTPSGQFACRHVPAKPRVLSHCCWFRCCGLCQLHCSLIPFLVMLCH